MATSITVTDSLVAEVRTALRIKTTAFDEQEIKPLIQACVIDLNMAGVSVVKADDPSFVMAVKQYCKANFGHSDDSEKWRACYNSLRDSMALSKEYGSVQNSEETEETEETEDSEESEETEETE